MLVSIANHTPYHIVTHVIRSDEVVLLGESDQLVPLERLSAVHIHKVCVAETQGMLFQEIVIRLMLSFHIPPRFNNTETHNTCGITFNHLVYCGVGGGWSEKSSSTM